MPQRRYTKQDWDRTEALLREGLTYRVICARLGVSKTFATRVARETGLKAQPEFSHEAVRKKINRAVPTEDRYKWNKESKPDDEVLE